MKRSYLFGLVFLATALFAGCSLAPAPKTVASSPTAQLSVTPATVAFGSVSVGSSTSKKGSLTASNSNVTVSTVDESGEGYTLSGITFPLTVPAGQSVPFTVTFAPQTAGSAPGSLTFVSDASDTASATLSGTGTTQASPHTVSLSWSADTSSVVGYNIYRGTVSGGPYPTRLTSSPQPDTTFVDNTVQSSSTYFYVATAVDSDSIESTYSNQAKAVIP
jgi:Abnormal spindle-like microcephaly-assoc'd, ASPM-SPD-2-Hydin